MSEYQNDYNRSGMFFFVSSMIFVCLFFVYITFIHPGVDLKELPEKGAETMRIADGLKEKVDVSTIKNPWVSSDALVSHGKKLYKTNCAMCHGNEGKGDGVAGSGLVPKPRNLVKGGWKKGGQSKELFTTLTKGLAGTSMAAYGHMSVPDRWSLVHFIRSITKDKPEDDMSGLEAFAKSAK